MSGDDCHPPLTPRLREACAKRMRGSALIISEDKAVRAIENVGGNLLRRNAEKGIQRPLITLGQVQDDACGPLKSQAASLGPERFPIEAPKSCEVSKVTKYQRPIVECVIVGSMDDQVERTIMR